jgi:hypothetical protein
VVDAARELVGQYTAPNRRKLGGALLDQAVQIVEHRVEVMSKCCSCLTLIIKSLISTHQPTHPHSQPWHKATETLGTTISCDGSDDVTKKSIMAFVATNHSGPYFIKSMDTSGKKKGAKYLAKITKRVMKKVGVEHVRCVVMDGASANTAAGKLIRKRYPHVHVLKCVAHGVDRMMKDLAGGGEKKKIARLGHFKRLRKLVASGKVCFT